MMKFGKIFMDLFKEITILTSGIDQVEETEMKKNI